jgi:hypothetical protein
LLAALPFTALAGSKTVNGVTLYYPDSYTSCTPSDMVGTTGAGSNTVKYTFWNYDRTTNYLIPLGSATVVGDHWLPFPYPANILGTMEFMVEIEINGVKNSGQWRITCEPPPGGQGCTPGYWKNHLEDWPPTGYFPSDYFNTVFGVSYFSPTYTLLDAINQGGGGILRLARHGTAALLNAAHPAVNYPFSVAQVIAMVQAGSADPLAAANELGCRIP